MFGICIKNETKYEMGEDLLILEVYNNDIPVGTISKFKVVYLFKYYDSYLKSDYPSISLTLPKQEETFVSSDLFSVFSNMQCFHEGKMVEVNNWKTLCECVGDDFIGAINVKNKYEKI